MQFLNPEVGRHIRDGVGLKLNVGGGERPKPGFFNVDVVNLPGVDVLADLNEPLSDLPADSVDEVYTRHTLEHIPRLTELMGELHRVLRPGGRLEVIVPHFSNPYGYSDPTHVRFFGLYSFFYFSDPADQPRRKVPSFYTPVRFRVESVRLTLLRETWADKCVKAVLQPLANRSVAAQDWYERRMCRLFPVSDVRYVLRPVKAAVPPAARPVGRAA